MKKITAAAITAARAKALAMIAGTYAPPEPVRATRASRFNTGIKRRPAAERSLAMRSKDGQPA